MGPVAQLVEMKRLALRCSLAVIVLARGPQFCLFRLDNQGNVPDPIFQRALDLGYLAVGVIGLTVDGHTETESFPGVDVERVMELADQEFRAYAELERLHSLPDPRI